MDRLQKQIFQFSSLQWFFWSTWCTFGAFYVLYLNEQGFSSTSIGTAVSAMTFFGIVGQYFWGYLCDSLGTVKKVFILGMIVLAGVVLPFSLYQTPFLIVGAMALIGFIWTPLGSILDSWILETSDELSRNYGFVRAFGSIGFALLAVVFGKGIERFGWNIMFIAFGFFAMVTVLIASRIADSYHVAANDIRPAEKPNMMELFRNVDYVLLLAVSILLFIPGQSVITYLPMLLRHVGGTAAHQGTAFFVIAISEVPIFFLSRRFVARYRAQSLLLVSSVFYLLRIGLLNLAVTPMHVIGIGVLQSLSFGVYLPTVRYYINQIAPAGLKTTAQAVATSSFFGVAGILASFLGGRVIDQFGIRVLLRGSLVIAVLAALMMALLVSRDTGKKSSQQAVTING